AGLRAAGRPGVMGALNSAPASFPGGGRFLDPAAAIERARPLGAEGADFLDAGAESPRPYGGAVAVPVEEEIRRLTPVLPTAASLGIPVSIDTMKAEVAAWALGCGAAIVNDVWGLQRDPRLPRLVPPPALPVILLPHPHR